MLDWSISLFRVFGIRLELHLSFAILPAYFGYQGLKHAGTTGALWSLAFLCVVFACVVLHELGHSLTARQFGIRTQRILLMPIGGMAQFESLPDKPRTELLITIAGPLVNFALALLLLPFCEPVTLANVEGLALPMSLSDILNLALIFNLSMGLFNLLPVFPMDGGRILRSTLSFFMRPLKATYIASKLGGFLAGFLAILFLLNFQLLPAALFLFIFYAGETEYKVTRQFELFRELPVARFVDGNIEQLSPDQSLADAARVLGAMPYPRDLIITDSGHAVGILEIAKLEKTAERAKRPLTDTPIAAAMNRAFLTLQSADPLDTLLTLPKSKRQQTFPVYEYARLVGILDARSIEPRAYWERQAAKNRAPEISTESCDTT